MAFSVLSRLNNWITRSFFFRTASPVSVHVHITMWKNSVRTIGSLADWLNTEITQNLEVSQGHQYSAGTSFSAPQSITEKPMEVYYLDE